MTVILSGGPAVIADHARLQQRPAEILYRFLRDS
jgi:hypothetical protein